MVMPVPSQAVDVDIDGIGESWWTKTEWAARTRNIWDIVRLRLLQLTVPRRQV